MPYANDFMKVNIIGTSFNKKEIWNTKFSIITPPTDEINIERLRNVALIIKPRWQEFFTASGEEGFKNTHTTTEIKVSHIGRNGKVVNNEVWEEFYEPPIRGQVNSFVGPGQIAPVVTLRSPVRKGPGALGRMYLPWNHGVVDSDGVVGETTMEKLRKNFGNFLTMVNASFPQFTSIGLVSPAGQGVEAAVTKWKIDSKLDTQRRRVNHLKGVGDFVNVTKTTIPKG